MTCMQYNLQIPPFHNLKCLPADADLYNGRKTVVVVSLLPVITAILPANNQSVTTCTGYEPCHYMVMID